MKITFAGNTTISYYCLEKLCRSGFKVDAIILPGKGYNKSTDIVSFTTLAGEFDLKQILVSSAKDFKKDIHTDLLIMLEWPERLNIPVESSLAVIGSNLEGQYSNGQLMDVAADIFTGKNKSEIQLTLLNGSDNDSFNRQSGSSKAFPQVISFSEFEINIFDDVRSVKAKAAGRIYRLLHDFLMELKQSGKVPDSIRRGFNRNRVKIEKSIDWHQSNDEIYNLIRSLTHPGPGAYTWYDGDKINIWRGHYFEQTEKGYENIEPGTVVDVVEELGLLVKAADGLFIITRLQPAGSPESPAWVWANNSHVKAYDKFECLDKELEVVK